MKCAVYIHNIRRRNTFILRYSRTNLKAMCISVWGVKLCNALPVNIKEILYRLRGRVVKGVGHLDHVWSYGGREVVSSIADRGNIVGWVFHPNRWLVMHQSHWAPGTPRFTPVHGPGWTGEYRGLNRSAIVMDRDDAWWTWMNRGSFRWFLTCQKPPWWTLEEREGEPDLGEPCWIVLTP